jgi:hypothetical protein
VTKGKSRINDGVGEGGGGSKEKRVTERLAQRMELIEEIRKSPGDHEPVVRDGAREAEEERSKGGHW